MAGRILGYLMVCENGYASFDELVGALHASKGSISQNVQMLVNQEMIVPKPVPHDRKTYYTFSESKMYEVMEKKMKSVAVFQDIFQQALTFQNEKTGSRQDKLRELVDFYAWMAEEITQMHQRWAERKKALNANETLN